VSVKEGHGEKSMENNSHLAYCTMKKTI